MKNLVLLLCAILLFLPVAKGQLGEIYGTVSQQELTFGNDGVEAVNVYVYQNDSLIICSESDSNGDYSLKPLHPGRYNVLFIKSDFIIKKVYGIWISLGGDYRLNVKLYKNPKRIKKSLPLPKGYGEIYGMIFDDFGNTIEQASIKVFQQDAFICRTVSQEDGSYAIGPLRQGNYRLEILMGGYIKFIMNDVIVKARGKTGVNVTMNRCKVELPKQVN